MYRKAYEMKHPTKEECYKLFDKYNTPTHVRGHCRAVAETACIIARELNKHGYSLNIHLIQAAGLLHDIARVEDKHGQVGAKWVAAEGYEEESRIIDAHMTYSPFSSMDSLTETDMVCLGDRLVMEDKYVGLPRRIQYVVDKAIRNGHPEIEHLIREKMKESEKFIKEIESVIGVTIDQLISDYKAD